MKTLKAAMVQFVLRREQSLAGHLQTMDRLVAEASAANAELVVFPEFSSIGMLDAISDHETTISTVADDYRTFLAPLFPSIADGVRGLAERHGVTVLGGSHNRVAEDGSLRNTAIMAHPDGRMEYQDKLHLTPPEHALGARGGDTLLVTKIGEFTAGVLICADIQFPELSRYLTRQGVDLIICPSLTWNRRGAHRVRTGSSARAIENQLFVVVSPLLGSSGLPVDAPLHAVGSALATTPVDRTFGLNDGILAIGDGTDERVVYADLDRGLLMASREHPETPGLALQRPDLYAELLALRGDDGDE